MTALAELRQVLQDEETQAAPSTSLLRLRAILQSPEVKKALEIAHDEPEAPGSKAFLYLAAIAEKITQEEGVE